MVNFAVQRFSTVHDRNGSFASASDRGRTSFHVRSIPGSDRKLDGLASDAKGQCTKPDIALPGWTALKNGDIESHHGVRCGFPSRRNRAHTHQTELSCGDSCGRYTSRREQASIPNFKARNGVSRASALRKFEIIEQKERLTWN
jgi:hypothetical protein